MTKHNLPLIKPELWSSALIETEHTISSWDGAELFYRAWHPGSVRKKALILFHGGHEHSGRFQDLVERLNFSDISVFAWDARGHGRSPGARGYAGHFNDLVKDADTFVRTVSSTYDIPLDNMVLMGHSVGSVIVATWLHDYAPRVRGAVLGSPAFNVKLYVPFALPALKLLQKFRPDAYVDSYVKPGMLTHDAEEAAARRTDPLISPKIAVRVLTSLFDTAGRVIRGANSITAPVLMLCAGSDWVVRRGAQEAFFERLGSSVKEKHVYPDFYHEIYHEKDRHIPIARAKGFIEQIFNSELQDDAYLRAGLNRDRYAELARPLARTNPKRYVFGLLRLAIKTVGKLSAGIRLGWQAGFDSGPMLDYVYENRARGWSLLGRCLDRWYLNTPGWRGIRQRGALLEQCLTGLIRELRAEQRPVHVIDVAAGAGRYVLDALCDLQDPQVSALCRDMDERGLDEGQRAAVARGLGNVRFEQGDAFDPKCLKRPGPRPNIVIVSGLYELFEDNELILQSLAGIHGTLQDDGYLIYTNQPQHPQLELIARTLTNREGQPWVMRPRPQAEMNRLVRDAGFEPLDLAMDDAGIFTVGVARKRSV